jgi:hypothetical protein
MAFIAGFSAALLACRMRLVRLAGVCSLACLLPAVAACSRTPTDPVQELLSELESAAEARDADRFGARLSEGFQGPAGLGRADSLALLRRYLAAYETVAIEVYGAETERSDGGARVRLRADFAGETRTLGPLAGLLPPTAFYRFELDVAEERGTWRVRKATWEAVRPPGETTP